MFTAGNALGFLRTNTTLHVTHHGVQGHVTRAFVAREHH